MVKKYLIDRIGTGATDDPYRPKVPTGVGWSLLEVPNNTDVKWKIKAVVTTEQHNTIISDGAVEI